MAVTPPRSAKGKSPSALTEVDLEAKKQDLGWLGGFLGSKDNAPVYIAGIIAIIALIGAIIVSYPAVPGVIDRGDAIKGLLAIVASALSFIGGASGRR